MCGQSAGPKAGEDRDRDPNFRGGQNIPASPQRSPMIESPGSFYQTQGSEDKSNAFQELETSPAEKIIKYSIKRRFNKEVFRIDYYIM